jgi:3-oxoacyl-[acyl-carrier-protein] synthase III
MSIRAVIRGLGSYLPEKIVTNIDLSKSLDTSHDWIVERTGIIQRHIADSKENTSDLAYEASLKALEHSGWAPQEIDLIIVATCTPDRTFPATAVLLQHKLQATKACAFDISAVCSGFIFGLATANAYIQSGLYKKILLVGAETLSRIVDWTDRNTAVLFGDGAGAMTLEAVQSDDCEDFGKARGVLKTILHSDGAGFEDLWVLGGPCIGKAVGTIEMNGRTVFKQAITRLTENAQEILDAVHVNSQAVDWFIPHQANKRIIDVMVENLGVSPYKVVYTGDRHANTSAASIPLAFTQAWEAGRLQKGQLVLINSFGAGFTWGSALIYF